MSDNQVRTVDKDIKTGLWQNSNNGRYIKVRSVGLTIISYSNEGCKGVYEMGVSELLNNYQLYEADKDKVVDDTFNDDTVAQTFGTISDDDMNKVPFSSFDLAAGDDKTVTCDFFSFAEEKPMRLIGIAGQARSGKDTLASYMLDNLDGTWLRSSFADPLKEMLRVIGVDCSDDAKAVVDDVFGVTPRHMMQTLGTEWGRHMIDSDMWVKAFARLNAGMCVIVPDVRFENEAALVREHGVLIHLTGRGGIEGSHVSENPIEFKAGDIVLDNSRDLAWLHAQVDANAVLCRFMKEVDGD